MIGDDGVGRHRRDRNRQSGLGTESVTTFVKVGLSGLQKHFPESHRHNQRIETGLVLTRVLKMCTCRSLKRYKIRPRESASYIPMCLRPWSIVSAIYSREPLTP